MSRTSEAFDLPPRAAAVDIDLQCALAFGRSALKTLVVLSEEACRIADGCLAEEAAAVKLEDHSDSPVIESMIEEMRAVLRQTREDHLRARELEDRLIAAMNALNGTDGD